MTDQIVFFIPGNVPSSKNSKQWTGKFLISSKTTREYVKNTTNHYTALKDAFRASLSQIKPNTISFRFVRNSRRRFDYINPLQTVQDLMVKHGWLDDDSADELLPILEPYEYSKENSGVYITIKKGHNETI